MAQVPVTPLSKLYSAACGSLLVLLAWSAGGHASHSLPSSIDDTRFQNAYATMMYCGTPKDYEFYVATRVLLQSIARKEPVADLVVIASNNCPEEWLQSYLDDGFKVKLVDDIPNPYKDQAKFNTRFIHALNKLYVWSLTEYQRVVMLDADNLFLLNTDELFQCGEFCAVFINPCVFHTGLFVLEPSNQTFHKMLHDLGQLYSADGADQGFLGSYFRDLIEKPFFRPDITKTVQTGQYRLPFGYQMDASYYYFRMKWQVPCGPNAVITFPSASSMKPWFWWSWPILPLGIDWHSERLQSSMGYRQEMPAVLSQAVMYMVIMLVSLVAGQKCPLGEKLPLRALVPRCTCISDGWLGVLLCPWLVKVLTIGLWLACFMIPFPLIPTTVHPVAGWGLYLLGTLSLLVVLLNLFQLPALPVVTPWMLGVCVLAIMASPFYKHGLHRMAAVGASAFLCSPFLWWTMQRLSGHVDVLVDREPLMSRACFRTKR
eukprot:SM000010S04388  [mRNA]  locus=s10:1206930:1209714:- [translate_table: standard]